jgi:hypothetical protein
MHVHIITIESKTGAVIWIFIKFAIFSMFRLSFQYGHIHVRSPNFHEYFFFLVKIQTNTGKIASKDVAKFIFKLFFMSKHMKFSEIQENPENWPGFGFYIHNTHVNFPKQTSLLYTRVSQGHNKGLEPSPFRFKWFYNTQISKITHFHTQISCKSNFKCLRSLVPHRRPFDLTWIHWFCHWPDLNTLHDFVCILVR